MAQYRITHNNQTDQYKGKITTPHIHNNNEVAERLTDMGKEIQTTKNNTAKQTRRARMLSNPDVKRWFDNLARGSVITAETRLRRLDKFCEIHRMTPIQLSELAIRDLRTVTDLLEDHVTMMESKHYSPGYIGDYVTAIKSWTRHFDVEIKRKIKVGNPHKTPTLQNERVPNSQELVEVYNRANLRDSVMISLMAKSGLRPETIGNHDGTDGLKMSDLPDIVIHQGVAKCIRSPNRITVREELSKARHQYFTFSTSLATSQLLAYLNDRLAYGKPLHGDSPVIAPDHIHKFSRGANQEKPFLPTRQISKRIREALRPRFMWRPYVFRAFFDTQLLIAESKGKIAHDFRVFFMGHRGSMEARYTTNKGILPEALVQEMSEAFKRVEEHLDLELSKEDPILKQKEQMQQAIQGATPEQLGTILEMFHTVNIGNMCQVSA